MLDIHVSSMAKAVGQALGGMESYCPGRRPAKESGEKLGHITTLGELGLSENQIKEFGLMLLAEGLLVEKEGVAAGTGRPFLVLHPVGGTSFSAQSDASKVAAAKRILAEHFNVSCPGMAKSNRGRFR